MSNPESVQATHKVIAGLTEAQQEMCVQALNRARVMRIGITAKTLPCVRFGSICSSLRREYDKTKNLEYLNLLGTVVKLGLS